LSRKASSSRASCSSSTITADKDIASPQGAYMSSIEDIP
jgi:hypothetical protein